MNKTSSAIVRALLLGTSCLSVFALSAAKADPTGGTVIAGSATINSNGNSTTINQSTNRALINWNTFSIAAGGSVRFNQPGTTAITVNRVTGAQSSTINGSLLANGQVWLING
ncbi:MAG TPA: filamentous hemagglutinin N-terminal domain-containing protein, partial [Rhizomicrobium sp.]